MCRCLYFYSVFIGKHYPFLTFECLEKAYSFCKDRNIQYEIQVLEHLKASALQLGYLEKFEKYEVAFLQKMKLMHYSEELIKELLKNNIINMK
jgi:hypothetical protein